MLRRAAERLLAAALRRSPSVALLGPRQAGKTTLARIVGENDSFRSSYLDLERPSDRAKLADAEAWFAAHSNELVILDEVHRAPEIFSVLRSVIDDRRRAGAAVGQFLLLGSASPALLQQGSETLAGRIAFVELNPLMGAEVGGDDLHVLEKLWIRGGFPPSFTTPESRASLIWREDFIRSYLERDIPMFGPRIPAETMRRFWTMLAHEQGTTINAARIAASLSVSGQTVARYLDLLVDLLLARRLPPLAANVGKRLTRSPKVYLRDSGIVHALLGLETLDDVLGHPVCGLSWEGFVVEHLIAAAEGRATAHFYRTEAGAEVDLVLDLPRGQRWGIEIKRSRAPTPSRGFHIGCVDIGATHRFLAFPGPERFPIVGGGEAVPMMELTRMIAEAAG